MGSSLGTLTDAEGRFVIQQVPVGSHQLRALLLGFTTQTKPVTVAAERTAAVDFALVQSALALDEVVVTATGQQRRRELGNSVSKLDAAQIASAAPITNVNDLLNGRSAGVQILPSNGTLGSGERIRIRGLSSASLSNDPLIYVDGVRVEAASVPMGGTVGVGGGTASVFDDLNPDDIASIEIVKGPSAATLYGTQAANGVIRITTKRGATGAARWTAFSEQGILQDVANYPGEYYSAGHAPDGTPEKCLPLQQAQGLCTIDQLYSINLMTDPATSPLKTGHLHTYGLQVSGGTDKIHYFLSGELRNEDGTLKMPKSSLQQIEQERGTTNIPSHQLDPNTVHQVNLRSNIGADLSHEVDVNLSSGFTSGTTYYPQTGDNLEGIYGSALFGTADPTATVPWGFAPPAQALAHLVWRSTDRFINSVQANWRPASFLSAHGTAGLDYDNYSMQAFAAPGEGCVICGQTSQGLRTINRYTNYKYSVDLGATASFDLTTDITSKTSVGAQYNKDDLYGTLNTAYVLPPGGQTIDAGSQKTSGEQTTETITLGTYIEQQFGWRDRLFATGAIRVDRNSAFGKDFRSATYPKASLSWVAIDTRPGLLNNLRFRSAYGASGLQPGADAAIQYLTPVTASIFATGGGTADAPAVTLGGIGNTTLKPERSKELETGVDATLLDRRVDLDLTYYYKKTTDALINRPLPGSLGATNTRVENLGVVRNDGWELGLNAHVVQKPDITWQVGLQGSINHNLLVTLGKGVPDITGFGYKNAPGFPLFGLWWPTLLSYHDANGDGVIVPSEVVVSDTAVFGGSSVPTRSLTFTTSASFLRNRVRVSALLDYRGGYKSHNVNTLFQCAFVQNCYDISDPNAPLDRQAAAVAGPRAFGAYFQDASFLKFREASITYVLPQAWLRALRLHATSITLTGRNLAMWTPFQSWDPEVNTQSQDGPNYNYVQAGQPRILFLRVNLSF